MQNSEESHRQQTQAMQVKPMKNSIKHKVVYKKNLEASLLIPPAHHYYFFQNSSIFVGEFLSAKNLTFSSLPFHSMFSFILYLLPFECVPALSCLSLGKNCVIIRLLSVCTFFQNFFFSFFFLSLFFFSLRILTP